MVAAAILCIGTELTRGEITNTNATRLASRLTALGFEVLSIDSVDDDPPRIEAALRRLSAQHEVLVCSGGLGPTTDDLTTATVAGLLGVKVERHEPSYEAMRRRYEKVGRQISDSNAKQTDLPEGADALPNPVGIAPGYAVMLGRCFSVFLPGVPREVEGLWDEQVEPRLRSRVTRDSFQIRLKTFGLPESQVGDRLAGLESAYPGLILGYRASMPEVEVKVLVKADSELEARERAMTIADEVRARLGDAVYGEGDDTFPETVARAIRGRGWRLALAESCTGGLVSHLLTSFPASEFFIASAVTYANSAKTRLAGVNEDILRAHGAVSPEVATAMAEGIRRACEVDLALAITGIAGPTGGTPEKPVGLVHWAVAHPGGTLVEQRVLPGDRHMIQRMAAHVGLSLLRRVCLEEARYTPATPRAVLAVVDDDVVGGAKCQVGARRADRRVALAAPGRARDLVRRAPLITRRERGRQQARLHDLIRGRATLDAELQHRRAHPQACGDRARQVDLGRQRHALLFAHRRGRGERAARLVLRLSGLGGGVTRHRDQAQQRQDSLELRGHAAA